MPKEVLECKELGFVMLRKCCTTSLKHAVLEVLGLEEINDIHRDPRFNYLSFEKAQKKGLKLVVIIRDPETRVLSAWRNKIHEQYNYPGSSKMRRFFPEKCDLETFLELLPEFINKDNHIKPQVKQLPGQVDYMLNFHDLENDWAKLRESYNYLPLLSVRNSSTLPKEKLATICTEEQEEKLKKIYSEDVKLFELLNTRQKGNLKDPRCHT